MSNRTLHRLVTKILLGDGLDHIHKWIDEPVKELGPQHRKRRHSISDVFYNIIRFSKDGDIEEGLKAGLATGIHIVQDNLHSDIKKKLRKLEKEL